MTGTTGGIGGYILSNLPNKFDFLILGRSKKIIKIQSKLKKNKKNINYFFYDQKKKLNIKKLKKKIKFSFYKNIHLIFFSGAIDKKINSFERDDWINILKTNLISHLEIFNSLKNFYKKNKNSVTNKVIFLSGGGATNPFPKFPAYSASKTAIVRTVENLSIQYSKQNLCIFAVAPGAIQTKMLSKVLKFSKVGRRSSKKRVLSFLKSSLDRKDKLYNGKLIHVRDKNTKISKKKKYKDHFKLRRIDK